MVNGGIPVSWSCRGGGGEWAEDEAGGCKPRWGGSNGELWLTFSFFRKGVI
jgi:hypothetical protein